MSPRERARRQRAHDSEMLLAALVALLARIREEQLTGVAQ